MKTRTSSLPASPSKFDSSLGASVFQKLRPTAILVLFCLAAGAAASALRIPAAWLIGPLFVSAYFSVKGIASPNFPVNSVFVIQSIIGVTLSGNFSPSSFEVLTHHWMPVLSVVLSMQLLTVLNAIFFVKNSGVHPATALLGCLPGGAGEMAAISDSLGADARLVSIMQYMRLMIIIFFLGVGASIIAHSDHSAETAMATLTAAHPRVHTITNPLSILGAMLAPVAVAFFGGFLGFKSRIPAGTLMVPMALSIACKSLGIPISFPPLFVFATYAALGMKIGSQFDKEILNRAKHLLFPLIGTSIFLALGSAGIGLAFAKYIFLDPTSAYLASTPGGLDSVAVVAGELKADSVVVLSVHFARLIMVILSAPYLVRLFSKFVGPRSTMDQSMLDSSQKIA